MRVKRMILKEGGNVFKTEPKDPESAITQRIATSDVNPTIDWLNKTFGFKFIDEDRLGTTGQKVKPDGTFEENSSGDIDLNVDIRELPKEEIIAKLTSWCKKQGIPDLEIMNKGRTFTKGWVANAGLQVHFRTPINGDPKNGFVQTDFMLTDNPDLQRGAKRGGTEKFTGADRAVLLSSLARGRGYKFSPTKGIVDPNNGDAVIANNWDKIAEILLGKGATEKDTHTAEQMLAKIKNDPNYEELVAGFKSSFEKQGRIFPETAKGIHHGIMLAEKNIIGKAFDKGKGLVKTAVAGAKAGYDISSQGTGKPLATYKKAGGGQTTVGQAGNLAKTIGNKIGGNNVIMRKDNFDDVKIAVNQTQKIAKLKQQGWAVFDPNRVVQMVSPDGKQIKDIKVGDPWYDKQLKLARDGDATAWKPYDPNKQTKKESINEDARIDHAEDLVYLQGSQGAMRALASLRNMSQGGQGNVTLKWDGSPAVVFGRNDEGEFVFTDKGGFVKKGGVGRTTSPDALKQELLMRKGGINKDKPDRIAFADNMGQAFGVFEKAVPKDYRGYFKGDLLYYNTPPVIEKNFVFEPNIVEYAVDVASDLGKKIAKSTAGVVVHRMVDPDGSEHPLKDLDIFQGNDLLVVPPVTIEQPAQVPNVELDRLEQIIKKDSADIDSLLDQNKLRQMQMTDFAKIIYKYMNSKVDTGLDNLGRDFTKWLVAQKGISPKKQQKIIEYIKQNMNAWTSLFEVITGIMKAKDSIIADLDKNPNTVKAKTAGKEGGEGYVLAHPEGDIKLVNRAGFTAANRAVER